MNRKKALLKKVQNIVDNIKTDELLKRIEQDEKEKQEYEIIFNDINIEYKNENNCYEFKNKVKCKKYEKYNNYDMEDDEWTSIKVS